MRSTGENNALSLEIFQSVLTKSIEEYAIGKECFFESISIGKRFKVHFYRNAWRQGDQQNQSTLL